MTLVATCWTGLVWRVFLAKMVMRSKELRTGYGLAMENASARAVIGNQNPRRR